MEQKIKCAGYVRVSSKDQIDGESLNTQRESIRNYAEKNGMKLTEIYADEGISGGSIVDRHALLKCLQDGQNGKFNVLIVHRLSRFGRNAKELLENHFELKQAGIELRSISEGIDFGTKYGEAMLGMLSIIAQLERDIIRETILENRIARSKRGIPTSGAMPFGRSFDRTTNKWQLDEKAANAIKEAAERYMSGESLWDIAEDLRTKYSLKLSYANLVRILKNHSGDKWTVEFKGEEPVIYDIPRILPEETIIKIKERLAFNKQQNRTDVGNKYVLTGFLKCESCDSHLTGQTQNLKNGSTYQYYRHPSRKGLSCRDFFAIDLQKIENAVFSTILENFADVPAFQQAIANSLPDGKLINELKLKIASSEKELKRIDAELNKLVDALLTGTLSNATLKSKETALLTAKNSITEQLENDRDHLKSMPDAVTIKKEADIIRRTLLEKYSGKNRLQQMTFDEKRQLLHWLFTGKDEFGKPYGIYINQKGKGKNALTQYFIYAKILIGERTIKGDNINFDPTDSEGINNNYKTKIPAYDL